MKRLRRPLLLALLATSLAAPGCASLRPPLPDEVDWSALERVQPWERDLLARPDMAWEPDALQAARHMHIYFSKEGSLAGGAAAGGGCGCN